jgi:ABC-type dipeptide/oligopeptide/nickel transport systems, permease components
VNGALSVLRRRPLAVAAIAYLVFLVVVAVFRGAIAPHSPTHVDLASRLAPPSQEHLLGTDELGRDVFARMVHGSAVSVTVGFVATAIALLVGVTLGALAGYFGGATDWIVSRLIEVVLCFPFLFLLLAIVALFQPSIYTIIIALGLTSWTSEARFIRGEFLRIRDLEFAVAARASGAGPARVIFRHLLPNAMAPVIVSASFGVASAILFESAVSFLGFGVSIPTPSWGAILASAEGYGAHAWWLVVFPGAAIFLTVAACHIVGEAVRDQADPRFVDAARM